MKHRMSYEVERDPEGNFWTVTCSCGQFQESGSTRAVVRHEARQHRARVKGDCFVVAANLQLADPRLTLVHGQVLCRGDGGTAVKGERHWHAWVEYTDVQTYDFDGREVTFRLDTVIDKANGNDMTLPAALYYNAACVEADSTRRYDADEARSLMLAYGHYGPWLGPRQPLT